MNLLEKMKLVKTLNQAVNERNIEVNPLKKIVLVKRVIGLRQQLGLWKGSNSISDSKEINVDSLDTDLFKYVTDKDKSLSDAVVNYIKQNLQGKYINTIIGKVLFNAVSVGKLAYNTKSDEIRAKIIPFVPKTLSSGKYLGREELNKDRTNKKGGFIAFHKFQDITRIENLSITHIVKVGERERGEFEFVAYYSNYERSDLLHNSVEQSPQSQRTSQISESVLSLDNVQLDKDIVNDDGWNIEIISITDLDGNPISLEDEQQTAANPEELFNYNPEGTTAKQRQASNNAAIEIVQKVQRGELNIEDITPEQKITLSTYSGSGGGLTTAEGTRGSSYEYYTPKPIAQGMWDLLKEMGFNGGTVLDPCAGTGIFSATAPANALIESVELDQTSGTINKILFNDDNHKVTISPFEAVAAATDDEIVDAVITNVPFGDNRGGNQFKDSRYQNENLESYFILRSLDKLRPNGLAVFMSGTGIMSGTRYRKIRQQISLKAEFMGAYRLPNKLFEDAGANVVTDVLVFKKHSRPNKLIIDELANSSPETLKEANVLWETFISGRYFKANPQYILGTESKVRSKYGEDVLAVMSDESVANIAKLLRRFEGSRIDWALLNTAAEPVITYQEGETLYFDGVLKEYKNGTWVNAKLAETKPTLIDDIYTELEQYHSPLVAIERDLDLNRLLELIAQVRSMGLDSQKIPQWVRGLMVSARNYS